MKLRGSEQFFPSGVYIEFIDSHQSKSELRGDTVVCIILSLGWVLDRFL